MQISVSQVMPVPHIAAAHATEPQFLVVAGPARPNMGALISLIAAAVLLIAAKRLLERALAGFVQLVRLTATAGLALILLVGALLLLVLSVLAPP
jgi:hypothetical protein